MPISEEQAKREIGRRVAAARRAARMTQEDLAEALDVNLVTISRLERGHTMPGVTTLLRICEAVDAAPSALLDLPTGANPRKAALARAQSLLRGAGDDDLRLAVDVLERLLRPGSKSK